MEKVVFAIAGWAHLWCRNNVRHSICLLQPSTRSYLCTTQNTGQVWENCRQNCHVILFTLRQSREFLFTSVCVLCTIITPPLAGNELVFLGHRAASPRVFCGFSQFLPFSRGMHWWETLTSKLYEIQIFSCPDVSTEWFYCQTYKGPVKPLC